VPETAIWIKDTKHHWIDWPYHSVSTSIALYYQIELGCYLHQLMWTEVSRSDAIEMISHHFIAILLIVSSFLTNYTRVGASIFLLHDLADIFLEAAKVFNYSGKAKGHEICSRISEFFFVTFTLTFVVTRLVLYPRYILYSVIIEGYAVFGCEWGGCYVFIGLLVALQCLHIFWFWLVLKVCMQLFSGKIEKDERSDDEEENYDTNNDNNAAIDKNNDSKNNKKLKNSSGNKSNKKNE
jgi:ceramide synthetase